MRHAVLALFWMLASWAIADDYDYAATVEQTYQNAKVHVTVKVNPAYGADHKISGTKCDILPRSTVFDLGGGFVFAARNLHSKLTVGSTVLYDEDMPGPPGGGDALAQPDEVDMDSLYASAGEPPVIDPPEFVNVANAYAARFASTHFTDGAVVPITLTVNFALDVWSPNGTQSVPITLTATINPKVYNKQLRWRTSLPPTHIVDFNNAIQHLLDLANCSNHSQSVSDNLELDESTILYELRYATAIGVVTHGYVIGGELKGLTSGGTFDEGIDWADFAAAWNETNPSPMPFRNWAIFYACAAFANPNLANDFHVHPVSGSVAGFEEAVELNLMLGPWLTPHAERVHLKLDQGYRLAKALEEANALQGGDLQMRHSNADTTTQWVFLTSSERWQYAGGTSEPFPKWWIVWGLGISG